MNRPYLRKVVLARVQGFSWRRARFFMQACKVFLAGVQGVSCRCERFFLAGVQGFPCGRRCNEM